MRRFVAVAVLVLAPLLGGCGLIEEPDGNEPPSVYDQELDAPESQPDLAPSDLGSDPDESDSGPSEPERTETTCIDVTSIDQNWDNDMLCTRPDGSEFYTDYEGASAYE
jgi:hypothetical protein